MCRPKMLAERRGGEGAGYEGEVKMRSHPESRVKVAHGELSGSGARHQAGQHLVLRHLLVLRLGCFPGQVLLRLWHIGSELRGGALAGRPVHPALVIKYMSPSGGVYSLP